VRDAADDLPPRAREHGQVDARTAARRAVGGVVQGEYGRDYAEAHGIDFTMADLVAIAVEHDRRTQALLAAGADPLIVDTDPLMTAVWADMLFDRRDPWFETWHRTADLYLLFDIDLPWIEDGTRLFGTNALRQKFFDLSKGELERRGVPWVLVSGQGEARLARAIAAIED
jgi:nicotinamide riboside kinase